MKWYHFVEDDFNYPLFKKISTYTPYFIFKKWKTISKDSDLTFVVRKDLLNYDFYKTLSLDVYKKLSPYKDRLFFYIIPISYDIDFLEEYIEKVKNNFDLFNENKNVIILLCFSHEYFNNLFQYNTHNYKFFEKLIKILKKLNIIYRNTYLLLGNPQNIDVIKKIDKPDMYFNVMFLDFWPYVAKEIYPSFNNTKIKLVNTKIIKKKFLFYNNRFKYERFIFFCKLKKQGILNDCLFSNNLVGLDKEHILEKIKSHLKNYKNLDITEQYVYNELLSNNNGNIYNKFDKKTHERNREHFNSTLFSIIPETTIYNNSLFITEKTYKTIASGHPFVLLSSPYSLQYLQSLGFYTFDDLIDTRYDTIENTEKRMDEIIFQIKKLNMLSKDELIKKVYNLNDKIQHNVDTLKKFNVEFYAKKVLDKIEDNYNEN